MMWTVVVIGTWIGLVGSAILNTVLLHDMGLLLKHIDQLNADLREARNENRR